MGPSDGRTVEELLKRSDLALYHAKSDGRGIYRHFDLDLQKKIDHRLDMERTLREALAEDQFELHYQPIVSARKPQVVGFEALRSEESRVGQECVSTWRCRGWP